MEVSYSEGILSGCVLLGHVKVHGLDELWLPRIELEADGQGSLILVEVQAGSYLEPSSIPGHL